MSAIRRLSHDREDAIGVGTEIGQDDLAFVAGVIFGNYAADHFVALAVAAASVQHSGDVFDERGNTEMIRHPMPELEAVF